MSAALFLRISFRIVGPIERDLRVFELYCSSASILSDGITAIDGIGPVIAIGVLFSELDELLAETQILVMLLRPADGSTCGTY